MLKCDFRRRNNVGNDNLNKKLVSKMSFSYEIYFEKWNYLSFSVKKNNSIFYKIAVAAILDL